MTKQGLVKRSSMTPEGLLLPNNLVEEILCRIPVTSLARLRSTCKIWNYLIKYDCRFQRKHSHKTPKQFLPLILNNDLRLCSLSVNLRGIIPSLEVRGQLSLVHPHSSSDCQFSFDIDTVFHCDGLLLCTEPNESTIAVWNPCTGETKWIDTPWVSSILFVLGYSQDKKSCKKSYKILRVMYIRCREDLVYKIYDLDSDSWRKFADDFGQHWSMAYNDRYVSLKGNAYWIASPLKKEEKHLGISILKFDFSTEKSKRLPLPYHYQYADYLLLSLSIVRDEKLSVLLQLKDSFETEIWVTNKIDDTQEVSWNKVFALSLNHGLQILEEGSFLLDEEKKVFMCCRKWGVYNEKGKHKDTIYIVGEDNKVTEVDFAVEIQNGCSSTILNYVPSLARIQRAGLVKGKESTE